MAPNGKRSPSRKSRPIGSAGTDRLSLVQSRLSAALAGTSHLKKGLGLCLKAALEISGLDCGGIYLMDPKARSITLVVHKGVGPAFVRSQKRHAANSPFFIRASAGVPLYTRAEGSFLRHFRLPASSPEIAERLKVMAAIPILARNRVVACLNVGSHNLEVIPAPVRRALEAVAGQIGLAVMRLRAEESVRESEAKYRKLIDDAGDAIFLVDVETGAIIEVNRRAAALTGRSLRELIGMHFTGLHPPRQSEQYKALFAEHVARRSALLADGVVQHKDGRIVPVEIASSLIEWHGRRMLQGIFRDMTERREAEKKQKSSHEDLRRLAAKLAETQENERRRIARELHDQVGQTLAGLALSLNHFLNILPQGHNDALRERLSSYIHLLEETTGHIRGIISDLRPPLLDEYGLSAALRQYAKDFSAREGVPVRVWIDDDLPRLKPNLENALFRIAQEALANAGNHAGGSEIALSLEADARSIHLLVRDDGAGFDVARAEEPSERPHWGLSIMKERAGGVGGQCRIVSVPGAGTQVIVEVPR